MAREMHPDVLRARMGARRLRDKMIEVQERLAAIRARRPSPSGAVVPEVDVKRRLTGLYLAPGTVDRFGNAELAAEIVAAIRESVADAQRQQRALFATDLWAADRAAWAELADRSESEPE
ncbi:YbaB/EbfC family nucleoid-associated protein [Nocardia stercoris]|uniref:YbaB/EbfC family DNA-binding protein n=1 Tax=Nocardia stercoris TaxID=2483361 RepID=A0A3M2L159_9NOCA|nr:YbaB/EbfC family nucleoid-associated protein [Nocardia stercoris]RMI29535.1 YbaB/EbfC family DNA-binding protein [Nocardia stercoris]